MYFLHCYLYQYVAKVKENIFTKIFFPENICHLRSGFRSNNTISVKQNPQRSFSEKEMFCTQKLLLQCYNV